MGSLCASSTPDVHNSMASPLDPDKLGAPILATPPPSSVAVGQLASPLSGDQALRDARVEDPGSIPFTDSETPNVVPDGSGDNVAEAMESLSISEEQMYFLLDSYFETTSGLLDLFAADEVNALVIERLRRSSRPPRSKATAIKDEDLASLDVALAIGSQSQSERLRTSPRHLHVAFFTRASNIAFVGMLAKPTLSSVRLFLLMAFYMLGVCNRNAASMYLGVALTTIDVLGIQTSSKSHRGLTPEDDSRRRILDSLTVINILTSFILGHRQTHSLPIPNPISPPGVAPTGPSITGSDDQGTLLAILNGCSHIDTIVQSLRTGGLLHVTTAECLLGQLRQWTGEIPSSVRQCSVSGSSVSGGSTRAQTMTTKDRQALIGNAHLACVYYFAVMLITRPFLVVYLISRLRGRAPDHLIDDPDTATDMNIKNSKVSKLAQVCVSSATCMVKTLQKVKESGYSFGNLCLLKAWVFGSGLVLGFSMFAGEPRQDIQEAFQGAREILQEIADISPQARVYHTILTDFAEAVDRHRRRISLEIRKTVHHYLDATPFIVIAEDHPPEPHLMSSISGIAIEVDESDRQSRGGGNGGSGMDIGDTELQINWADLDLYLVDYGLDSSAEPFQGLFYSVE